MPKKMTDVEKSIMEISEQIDKVKKLLKRNHYHWVTLLQLQKNCLKMIGET